MALSGVSASAVWPSYFSHAVVAHSDGVDKRRVAAACCRASLTGAATGHPEKLEPCPPHCLQLVTEKNIFGSLTISFVSQTALLVDNYYSFLIKKMYEDFFNIRYEIINFNSNQPFRWKS